MHRQLSDRQRRLLGFARELGLDPTKSLSLPRGILRFARGYLEFKKAKYSDDEIVFSPSFHDSHAQAGSADGHYFWQDFLCAKWIAVENPKEHFDVGSRIDGFIAHVLMLTDVTQLDIRPMESKIPGLKIEVADLQKEAEPKKRFSSVSSLHSVEHFGLGRYGDKIEPDGHRNGLVNLSKFVENRGYLYISFPIGHPRVEFNSQRIIHPEWPIEILENFNLVEFILIPWKGSPIYDLLPSEVDVDKIGQAGLYKFQKIK